MRRLSTALAIVITVVAAPSASVRSQQPADLVLRGGKIVTVDDEVGTVQALAARGGRIVAVGSDRDVAAHVGESTRVIELRGRLAIPGFIEGHGHFTGIGVAKQRLDLMQVRSWDEVVSMVAEAVAKAKPGEWIRGRGWHQEKWDAVPERNVEGFPIHDSISAVSPNNPVVLTHASGHASFVNQKAMELAGIDKTTRDPDGGEILRDENGDPTGVLRERASGLISRADTSRRLRRDPDAAAAQLLKTIQLADQACLEAGVTSFQDAGSSFALVDTLKEVIDRGELGVRLWLMIRENNQSLARNLAKYKTIGYGDHRLTVRAVKRSIDGALGPRGAWLLEPYSDLPTSRGLETASVESVTETARLAMLHGYQACIHAIGDRANREVLDIFEAQFRANPGKKDLRWRIEHAQHIHPDDIPRFGKLGVIASMQGVHCTSDAVYVLARLGEERAKQGAYVWKTLRETGALVTNGTDAPVEHISPIESYYATVTRRLADGSRFFPEQCLSRMDALRSYTIWCAMAAFEEDIKGSLTPGKLADIVVLSKDILTCPDEEILEAGIDFTIVGGVVKFEG